VRRIENRREWHGAHGVVAKCVVAATLALAFSCSGRAVAGSLPCGDLNDDGSVTASDALSILRAAVGTDSCDECVCDVDGSGSVAATDALIALNFAVGENVDLACPPCATTTSTTEPPLLLPCGDPRAGTPQCDGFCGVDGQMCAEASPGVCECIFFPAPCGAAAGAPQCWGSCAKGAVCVQVGSICECLF